MVIKIQKLTNNISIALCTCNGGSYLEEQLDSIAGQTLLPAELVACDDRSTDNTLEVLEGFARRARFPVRVYSNEKRLGAIANFSRAVGLCRGDYVALCDQDDTWQPGKLAVSLQEMRRAEEAYGKNTPLLLHTDLAVAGSGGRVIAPSFMKMQKIAHVSGEPLKTLLVQNFVTGCTTLLNRPLVDAALPVPEEAMMHDWWFALIAAVTGKLLFYPQPTVIYRQHGRNTIGAKRFLSGKNVMRMTRVGRLENTIAQTVKQGRALDERLKELDCGEVPFCLPGYLEAAMHNGKKAVKYARKHGIGKQGRIRNALFLALLYKSGYLAHLEESSVTNSNHC